MEGSGKIDLPEQHLYYHATVALVKSCEEQRGKGLYDLANYPIPVTINGPIGNLEVKPNLTEGILKILEKHYIKALYKGT